MEAVIKGVCAEFGVGTLKELATDDGRQCYWDDVDEFRKVRRLVQTVNDWVVHYKFTRVVCTLGSLEQAIVADFKGEGVVKQFDDLQLGPLLAQPEVLALFPGAKQLQTIPHFLEADFYVMAWTLLTNNSGNQRRFEFEDVSAQHCAAIPSLLCCWGRALPGVLLERAQPGVLLGRAL
jgi:hypothetical protein